MPVEDRNIQQLFEVFIFVPADIRYCSAGINNAIAFLPKCEWYGSLIPVNLSKSFIEYVDIIFQ